MSVLELTDIFFEIDNFCKLMEFTERIFLRKRSLIENVYPIFKDVLHIDHTRHRNPNNFLVNLISELATYCLYPNKPKLRPENVDSNFSILAIP